MLAPLLACEESARVTAAAVAEKMSKIETARAFPRQHAGDQPPGSFPALPAAAPDVPPTACPRVMSSCSPQS